MGIAIMLYGYWYIDHLVGLWRAPHSKNQLKRYSFVRDTYPYFVENIYMPLKKMYTDVDVYMIAFEFDHPKYQQLKNELMATCKYFTIFFTNQHECPTLPYTYWNLVKKVSETKKYDRYIITRGDLFYKDKITNWMPPHSERDACWFLFKDYKHTWDADRIICDIIFIIDNNIEKFKKSVKRQIELYPERTELHGIYHILRENFGENVNSIVEGYYDSNTGKKVLESNNPIYIMINRPYFFDMNGIMKNVDQQNIIFKQKIQSANGSVIPNIKFSKQVNMGTPNTVADPIKKMVTREVKTENPTNKIVPFHQKEINDKLIKQKEQKNFLANISIQKVNTQQNNNKICIIGLKRK